jgi:peptidoglycan/LPS O-acetylase OafA/YrhL
MFNGFGPLHYGWAGVELFFVISGFVIIMTLKRSRSVLEFALQRFARLWPAMFVSATITAIVINSIGPVDWKVSWFDYVTSIFFIGPDVTATIAHKAGVKWVDGAYWTLWVEVRFYALAALAYWIAGRRFILLWLVFQLAVFSLVALRIDAPHFIDAICIPQFLPYFTLGISIYSLREMETYRSISVIGMAAASVAILYNSYLGLIDSSIGFLICNLLIVAIMLFFAVKPAGLNAIAIRPLRRLGESSYSLYLLHQCLGIILIQWLIVFGVPYIVSAPIVVALAIFAAYAQHRWIENPAKRFILRHAGVRATKLSDRFGFLRYKTT